MSPNRIRVLTAVALASVAGLMVAAAFRRVEVLSSFGGVVFLGAAFALLLFAVFDLVIRRIYWRRLEWVHRFGDELRSIARGEQESLSTAPSADLEPLRAKFSEVAEAIRKQHDILEQQRSTLAEILNGMGEGLLAIDDKKRIVLANDRISDLFGVRRAPRGRKYYEVLRHNSLVEAFDHGLQGAPYRERATVVVGNQERQVEIRVMPAAGDSGIAAVALVIDVSQIEMLARMRQEFIADFSHEVRTPLAGLRSSIETLQTGSLQRDQEDHLHRILDRQLGRLERLVSDLAELNSIESGETILHREPTELRQLLFELAEDFRERAEDRKIAITVDGVETVAEIDPIRIEQVFSNLIDNALKHAPESDEVKIDVIDHEHVSEVRVSDRGPGIPREEREKVFHRFYRMDKSRSTETAGTGLGLAITKHLVIQHGGTVAVDGDLGQGTTFVVRLPKQRGRSRPSAD